MIAVFSTFKDDNKKDDNKKARPTYFFMAQSVDLGTKLPCRMFGSLSSRIAFRKFPTSWLW